MNEYEEKDDCEVPQRVQLLRWRKGVRTAAYSLRMDSQGQGETESARRTGNDHDERGWRRPVVSHGKPDAGNPHVRFEEGAGVPYGGASLYSTKPVPSASSPTGVVTADRSVQPLPAPVGEDADGTVEGFVE